MATQPVVLFAEAARYAPTRRTKFAAELTTLGKGSAPCAWDLDEETGDLSVGVVYVKSPIGRAPGSSQVLIPRINLFEAVLDQVGGLPESYTTTILSRPESGDPVVEADPLGTIFVASPDHDRLGVFALEVDPSKLRRWNPEVTIEAWEFDEDDA